MHYTFYQTVRKPMRRCKVKEYPLWPLLQNHSVAADVQEPASAPFSASDNKQLLRHCRHATFQCDSAPQHLRIEARRGGFLKGNLCFIAGVLFTRGSEQPVASITIHFGPYTSEPEIRVQSLVSRFEWTNLPPGIQPLN